MHTFSQAPDTSTDTSNPSTTADNILAALPDPLDSVRAQFDRWRSTHVGRRHIPDHLWAAAIRLLDLYPISVVSQHLRLNSSRLQHQQNKLLQTNPDSPAERFNNRTRPAKPKKTNARPRGPQTKTAAAPLSLDFLPLAAPSATHPLCSIVIERTDGSRLTVRVPADSPVIESLWVSFLRP